MSQPTSFRKYVASFWLLLLTAFACLLLLFFFVSSGAFGKLPSFIELENPKSALATEIISSDHLVLGKYYSQNRSNIKYENLPQNLVNALVATEDARYYGHAGIDFKALIRVMIGVATGKSAGGGSTITQQLAKNLFPRKRLNKMELIIRKLKEWVIAVKLERSYTKEEIVTMYLNTVPFSDNAFGIKAAARTYFNKPVDSLELEEAAVLVGMLKAPTKYNPRINPENSTGRRNVVISQMEKYGFIEKEVKDSLQASELKIEFTRSSHDEGLAPYFRETLKQYMKAWCVKNPKPDGTTYDIYNDGLKIYTTLDSRMQNYAEEAVAEHLTDMQKIFFKHWKSKDPWKDYKSEWDRIIKSTKRYDRMLQSGSTAKEIDEILNTPVPMKIFTWNGEVDTVMSPMDSVRHHRMFLQTGMISIDPLTGHIKSWVGGINYKYFQYDHAGKNAKRQIGSTFKPFVYAVAIDQKGLSPCYQVPNELVTFEKDNPRWSIPEDWTPKNSDNKYGGIYTLKQGLAKSVNTITAYLMHEMNPKDVVTLTKNMGITGVPPLPSICLGTPEVSVFEMVGAYSTFANKGLYLTPVFITRIEDKNGNVLEEFPMVKSKDEGKEALTEEKAYVMLELLRNVVNSGTGRRLRFKYGFDLDIAGKTGTTQNHSDGWFMGVTPELVTGVWVGCDDRFVRFRTINYGQGASTALPIWAKYYKKVYEDPELGFDKARRFEAPAKGLSVELDCSKYEEDPDEEIEPEYGSEYEVGSEYD